MSLHALAGHMASKGRGSDSMLVHMTPEEVQSLQVLALKGGGTLTINPDTGLPEANFLKKMLPMIAGAALNFFAPGLGSAVGGMFGLGAAAGTGIAVGGISALATGSLSRGLMAGLGAYGGASLAGGLQNLGATAVAPEALAAANASADPIMSLTAAKEAATAAGIAPAAGAEAAKQGLAMAANNPKSFMTAMGGPAKALGAAYAAATPVLAGEMVPTTTQMPDSAASKAYIRPKRFDPYTQQMVSYDPILASEFGNRRLSDFTSGDGTPGSASGLMSLDSRRSTGMASGGIVALAAGGTPSYFEANPDVAAAYAKESYGLSPEQFAQTHYEKYGQNEQRSAPVSQAEPARAGIDAFQIGTGQGAAATQYLATNPDVASWLNSTEGTSWAAQNPGYDPSDIAWTHYVRYGADEGRKWGAPATTPATTPTTTPATTTTTTLPTNPQTNAPPGTKNPYGNANNPGDLTFNSDGTTTVTPNIPGRPYGGFSGMDEVKDAYTAGGGSLGYTPYAPATLDEFQDRYTNTGGSKQAYDFLANRGGADVRRPITKTGELMLPYYEVMNMRRQLPAGARAPAVQGKASGGIVALAAGGISADQAQKLIEAQYATIGRSGVGAGANQIDQSGLQGWTDALVRGDFRPEDLSSRFSSAVTDYMAQNPNDQYTQYVTQFRANQPAAQQAPAFTNFNASQINDYIANNNLDAAGVTAATKQFNVDPNAIINAQNAQETVANVYRNVLGRDPDPVGLQYWTNQVTSGERTGQEMYQEFLKSAQSLLGQAGAKEIFRPGISLEDAVKPFAGYSSADKRNIADEWVRNTLGREVTDADRQQQWYKDATSAASMNTYGAAQNIFGQFQNYAAKTGQSQADALANARSILAAKNLTEADVLAQTGKSLSELVRGTNLNLGLFQASQLNAPGSVFDLNSLLAKAKPVIPAAVTGVPDGYYGNPSGPAPTPGDITRNPDGTVTVHPNIPGRPTGGFSGMQQVKDAYTAGGGSLGYTPYAPKTLQEFQDRYTNTGGSKQAYDFLANKGAADIKRPITKTGELMLPYADIMGLRRQRPAGARAPVVEEKEVVAAPTAGTGGAANGGVMRMALGGLGALAGGGQAGYNLGGYSDGGRLLRGPGDGVSDSIPATIGDKQPARLADGEFVVPARIVSELGNGSTEAGARKLYAMMDRVQKARGKTTGKNRVAANTRSEKFLPA
jgi:hypothetical protein